MKNEPLPYTFASSDAVLPGMVVQLSPCVRRLTAFNSSQMTGPGTNTYLIGFSKVAVVDPGPADPDHVRRIAEVCGDALTAIFVTHTHLDHSPAAAMLRDITGAKVFGLPAPEGRFQDTSFSPDIIPSDRQTFFIDGVLIRTVYTPGHASNHVCYLLENEYMLFTGDHIMQGATVVVPPPDGDMKAYLQSLRILLDLPIESIAPGHGKLMTSPRLVIENQIEHRLDRERQILRVLDHAHPMSMAELLADVYKTTKPGLLPVAERTLLAHLLKLESDGSVIQAEARWRAKR